ncbi:Protein of unknown function [Marivirga sericea]|uniref:DUF429 domain-containing protein n=1 Tax=Marivirga sericea TaxID=1028 RepID=A0A1X7IGS7_9BACT|nr:DUF429 domain-containing protein [Marivirga sericea]SMG13760.1 Protein of unknown function [Marivirga sericea]
MDKVLCIGLDIAWFGGSKNNKASKYDCLVSLIHDPKANSVQFNEPIRVSLHDKDSNKDRDPTAQLLSKSIDELLEDHSDCSKVIFAIDAPLQTTENELGERKARVTKGSIKRRACENHLSKKRKCTDKGQKDIAGWMFRIQAGAPLAPRVKNLLTHLESVGFSIWDEQHSNSDKLVIECFPAEVIWFTKRSGGYKDKKSAQVKAYKKKEKEPLSEEEVKDKVHHVLADVAPFSGIGNSWNKVVDNTIDWMIKDKAWKTDKGFRSGKMLDDVVDSCLCLASAVSYSANNFHVWQDPEKKSDGHIIGPGKLNSLAKQI